MWADASPRGAAQRPDPIAALRERIEILEEENRQLREMLVPNIALPPEWRLQRQARRLLVSVRTAAPGYLSWERCAMAMYGFDDGPGDPLNVARVRVYHLRKRLQKLQVPIQIKTIWGQGLLMPPESVAVFDRLTEGVAS